MDRKMMLRRLVHLPPWKDHERLNARTLLDHEAQQISLAHYLAQAPWGLGNFGLLDDPRLELSYDDESEIRWRIDEVIGITSNGRLLSVIDVEGAATRGDTGGYLMICAPSADDAPHPLWHQGIVEVAGADKAVALVEQGSGFPVVRFGSSSSGYLPPAMRLDAHPDLWKAVLALADRIETLLARDDALGDRIAAVWYPGWVRDTLAMMPPRIWIVEHVRTLKRLTYSDCISPRVRGELRQQLQDIVDYRLDLHPILAWLEEAWTLVDQSLTNREQAVVTLKDENGRCYHPITTSITDKTTGNGAPCLWIQLPEQAIGHALWLAIKATDGEGNNPGECRLTFNTPKNSLLGIKNTVVTFRERWDEENACRYWVAEVLTSKNAMIHRYTHLSVLTRFQNTSAITVFIPEEVADAH